MTFRLRLSFGLPARSRAVHPRRSRLSPWSSDTECDGERADRMHWRFRMLRRLLPLVATIVLAMTAVEVHAHSCAEAQANKLFVEAAELIRDAKAKNLDALKEASANLNKIVKEYACTSIAVHLASGQSIGDISLSGVQRQIAIERRRANAQATCLCTRLVDELENDDIDAATIETVARRLVRVKDFECARHFAAMLEAKKRNSLHRQITRAQARAVLKKERCSRCDLAQPIEGDAERKIGGVGKRARTICG